MGARRLRAMLRSQLLARLGNEAQLADNRRDAAPRYRANKEAESADRDGDGVPNRFDRAPGNPYRGLRR